MPKNRHQYGLGPFDFPSSSPSEPTPFPIRLIQDPLPPPPEPEQPSKPKNDQFYPAWDKFLSVQPTRAKVATKPGKELHEEKEFIEKKQAQGLRVRENVAHSWEEAAAECREKVAAIVEECKRLNQKYKDVLFDLESNAFCLRNLVGDAPSAVNINGGPPWIKRVEDIFENPVFYSEATSGTDIHQGQVGDCWFIAALVAVSAKRELIDRLCVARDEKVGVYGFVFYRDGEWIYEVIDDKLFIVVGDDNELSIVLSDGPGEPGISIRHDKDKLKEQMQKGSDALYFSRCKSNETWLPLIEKAYAKAHGDYAAIEGGYPSEGIEDLTGGVATSISPEDIMDKDRFWDEQMSQVNKKYLFGGGGKQKWDKGVVPNHAYTVLEAWSEGDLKLLKIRNPWGEGEWEDDWSDGSKQWTPEMMRKLNHTFGDDGIFWMSYKDFLKHFPNLNRVRLFDKDWQVAQLWTCVNVPWTVDYLDTRFEITVSEKTPIVVALQQPDERYFSGLQGRYRFSLHFRLYREKESGQKYLMRSVHNSGADWTCQRSVSAELEDIEPGKYYLIFKISAYRVDVDTAHEAIIKYAEDRKDKLLQVGRCFDYAQTKGNLKAMEKKVRKQQRGDKFDRTLKMLEEDRKYTKISRERTRERKKRIVDATNEKRKVAFEKAAAKRKAQKASSKQQEKDATAKTSTVATEDSKLTPSTESTADAVQVEKAVDQAAASNAEATTESVAADKDTESATGKASESAAARDTESATDKGDEVKTEVAPEVGPAKEVVTEKESEQSEKPANKAAEEIKPVVVDNKPADKTAEESKPLVVDNKSADKVHEDHKPVAVNDKAVDIDSKSVEDKPTTDDNKAATAQDKDIPPILAAESKPESIPTLLAELVKAIDSDGSVIGDDEAWETPAEEMEELDDNDFDWDPKMDGPLNPDTSSIDSEAGKDIDIFNDDPWNALCVLGLRVYSKCKVGLVVRTTDDEHEKVDVEV